MRGQKTKSEGMKRQRRQYYEYQYANNCTPTHNHGNQDVLTAAVLVTMDTSQLAPSHSASAGLQAGRAAGRQAGRAAGGQAGRAAGGRTI